MFFLAAGFARKIMDLPQVSGKWRESAAAPQTPWLVRPCTAEVSADPRLTACIKALSPKRMEINYFSVNTSNSYQFDA